MITYSIIKKSQLEGALRLDAEYYQPEYLHSEQRIKKSNARLLKGLADDITCGPFGSAILNEDYKEAGVPLLRVSDLNDWFVKVNDLVFIDDKLSQKMRRYQVSNEDIVVSQRGTIAMFSKVTDKFPKWNISANLISIKKSNKINFDYLLAFLNSSYGINQLYRRLSGQVQPKITTDDIKNISVFIPSDKEQENIAKHIKESWKRQENSKKFYSEAENLLLEELGLKDFENKESLFNVVNLSDVKKANRIDAEYFQSKFNNLLSRVKTEKLGDLVSMTKGFEPGAEAYQENGKLFIRVSSVSREGIIDKDQKYLSDELYQKLKNDFEPKVGEILLTKDATPGIAYVLKEPIEGIICGGILKLKTKENIEPEFLAFCISSIIGKSQVERDAGGSVIAHWKPEQIKNLQIPVLPKVAQQKIADLVKKSHEARKKAKELLEETKQKVEKLIEE